MPSSSLGQQEDYKAFRNHCWIRKIQRITGNLHSGESSYNREKGFSLLLRKIQKMDIGEISVKIYRYRSETQGFIVPGSKLFDGSDDRFFGPIASSGLVKVVTLHAGGHDRWGVRRFQAIPRMGQAGGGCFMQSAKFL